MLLPEKISITSQHTVHQLYSSWRELQVPLLQRSSFVFWHDAWRQDGVVSVSHLSRPGRDILGGLERLLQ